jgi:hypothetical protein
MVWVLVCRRAVVRAVVIALRGHLKDRGSAGRAARDGDVGGSLLLKQERI